MINKLFLIITLIVFSQSAHAQYGNMITNKLLEKSQQKKSTSSTSTSTKKEVEQKEAKESESSEQVDEKAYQNMMGGSSTAKNKVQAEYLFQSNVVMLIEVVDKTGKSEGKNEMILHINKDGNYSGSEMKSKDAQGGISIFDWTNRIMISLMNQDGKKIGMVMDLKENGKETKSNTPLKFTKTGKTKSITGYSCEEYIAENEETNMAIWLTQTLDFNISKSMEYFSQQNNSSNYSKDAPKGFMMESTTIDKKNGSKSIMIVTQVNKFANKTFKTSEYTFY